MPSKLGYISAISPDSAWKDDLGLIGVVVEITKPPIPSADKDYNLYWLKILAPEGVPDLVVPNMEFGILCQVKPLF